MNESQEIALVRHPEVAAAEGYCLGQSDVPLSEHGKESLPDLVEKCRLWRPELILASDRECCVPVAKQTARRLQLEAVEAPVWREQGFGQWEGLAWSEIRERFPEAYEAWAAGGSGGCPPGGESLEDMRRRVADALRGLVALPPQRILVVTHLGVIRTALCASQGRPLQEAYEIDIPYGSLTSIDAEFLW
jgi:broad specificity phosphatase PhoE